MNDIDLKLKAIVISHSRKEISENDIKENSILTEDFGFDSLNMIEMIVSIESEFDITIDDEDMELDVLTQYSLLRELVSKKLKCYQQV